MEAVTLSISTRGCATFLSNFFQSSRFALYFLRFDPYHIPVVGIVSVNWEIYYKYLCEFVLPLVANVSVILVVQMISFIVVGSS